MHFPEWIRVVWVLGILSLVLVWGGCRQMVTPLYSTVNVQVTFPDQCFVRFVDQSGTQKNIIEVPEQGLVQVDSMKSYEVRLYCNIDSDLDEWISNEKLLITQNMDVIPSGRLIRFIKDQEELEIKLYGSSYASGFENIKKSNTANIDLSEGKGGLWITDLDPGCGINIKYKTGKYAGDFAKTENDIKDSEWFVELEPGPYKIFVLLNGKTIGISQITVKAGIIQTVSAQAEESSTERVALYGPRKAGIPFGATLIINGNPVTYQGSTVPVTHVPPGRVTVSGSHRGYRDVPEKTFQAKGKRSNLPFKKGDWVKKQGTLVVKGLKQGAGVRVHDDLGGIAASSIPEGFSEGVFQKSLQVGEYTVMITRPGYESFQEKFSIEDGKTITLEPAWEPKKKEIRIGWVPAGGKVRIGKTELEVEERNLTETFEINCGGPYSVTASHQSYKVPLEADLEVKESTRQVVSLFSKEDWRKKVGRFRIGPLQQGRNSIRIMDTEQETAEETHCEAAETGAWCEKNWEVGTYRVQVSHPWFEIDLGRRGSLEIREGQTATVDLTGRWERKVGKVTFLPPSQTAQSPRVSVDGEEVSPKMAFDSGVKLAFGPHQLRGEHPLYHLEPSGFTVNRKEGQTVKPAWVRKRGTLIVDTSQSVPGTKRARTEYRITKGQETIRDGALADLDAGFPLPTGTYDLTVTHWQYRPWTQPIRVEWKRDASYAVPELQERRGRLVLEKLDPDCRVEVDGMDRTDELRDDWEMEIIVGTHAIRIWDEGEPRQYRDLGFKGSLEAEGGELRIATERDWRRHEIRGRVVFRGVEPGSELYVDGTRMESFRPGGSVPLIVGPHSFRIAHPAYLDFDETIQNLQPEETRSIQVTQQLPTFRLKARGFEEVVYFDGDEGNLEGPKLELKILKGKEVYVLVMRTSAGRDPWDHYRCLVLPLGLQGSLARSRPESLMIRANGGGLTLDGGEASSDHKVFVFDESGVNLDAFQLPAVDKQLEPGTYRLTWEGGERRIQIPYCSYAYVGPLESWTVEEAFRHLMAKEKELVAFHLARLYGLSDLMREAWFSYCRRETLPLLESGESDPEQLRAASHNWSRMRFERDARVQEAGFLQNQINIKIRSE